MNKKATKKEANKDKSNRKKDLTRKKKSETPDNAPDSVFAQLEKEIELGYREIDTSRDKVRIYHPTIEQEAELNDMKTRFTGKFSKDMDMMYEDEMRKWLGEHGVWGKEDDEEGEKVVKRISNLYADILMEKGQKVPNKERIKQIETERGELIEKRNEWLAKRAKYFSNTIEYRVDERMIVNKLVMCVKDTKGNPIWEDIEALNKERDRVFINKIVNESMFFWAGWMPDFFERLQGEESGDTDTKSA